MRIGSVCTGIGGLDLGFERAGFEVAWMAEIDPWASRVLEKRWPQVPNIGDWTELWKYGTGASLNCDLLIGGIPCQGHSVAGRRGGKDDARNLWPDFAELVDALRPAAFVVENVPGLLTSNDGDFFAEVLEDCDRLGYSVEWDILSAAFVGAPHRRDRVWILGRRDGRQTWPQREQPTLFPGRPEKWPKAGRWTDGTLHERERQWPTPSAPGWTTPRAGDSKQGPSSTAKHLASGDLMLTDEVRLWPSATVEDSRDSGAACYSTESGRHSGVTLTDATRRLPEPRDGRLNPDWCETLMNLPVGWTDPSCDEPEPRPYPWPMACGNWPTPNWGDHRSGPTHKRGNPTLTGAVGEHSPLYGASPQAPWEPPRLVEPVKGDGRRHRLRCIGNAVVPACAEVIARSIAASLGMDAGEMPTREGVAGVPWPTPNAGVHNDGEELGAWQSRKDAQQAQHRNGNGFGTPLTVAVRLGADDAAR